MSDTLLFQAGKQKLVERTHEEGYTEILVLNGDGFENTVWMDEWQCDCPEDLTWSRTIRDVFMLGFNMGKQAK